MPLRKLSLADADFQRSPGQDADIYTADMVDSRHGAPIAIGFGRYGPNQRLEETMVVDDVMIVLDGRLTVSAEGIEVSASRGDIVHMPKGTPVAIQAHEAGATTAYVTYPPWRDLHD